MEFCFLEHFPKRVSCQWWLLSRHAAIDRSVPAVWLYIGYLSSHTTLSRDNRAESCKSGNQILFRKHMKLIFFKWSIICLPNIKLLIAIEQSTVFVFFILQSFKLEGLNIGIIPSLPGLAVLDAKRKGSVAGLADSSSALSSQPP